jgi:multidrug efflux pump subunit AcrA (membrane-fusion protein)
VTSEAEIDQARREELAARNALQTLKNQLELWKPRRTRAEQSRELATVQLEKAQLDLSRTKIIASIDGTIVSDPVEIDAFVDKGDLLARINDTSCAEVKCSLKMDELYWLWRQQEGTSSAPQDAGLALQYEIPRTPVTVSYSLGGNEYRWEGVLSRFEGAGLDEKTRTVPCRVLVSSPREVSLVEPSGATHPITTGPRALTSGMFVTVKIHSQPEAALLRIPARAIRPGNVVWKAREGKLTIEPVHIVEAAGDDVILHGAASNLASGDAIIVSPLPVVNSGMAIRERAL